MDANTYNRLFDYESGFEDIFFRTTCSIIGILLVLAFLITIFFKNKFSEKTYKELKARIKSWFVIVMFIFIPMQLGAFWTILAIMILSILCYREFARTTGLFHSHFVSFLVVISILFLYFSIFDHWYNFFMALSALGSIAILSLTVLFTDNPKGYIQRVSLGLFSFIYFGFCLGHAAYICNDTNYRSILLMLFILVEGNDICAFLCGKSFGKRKIFPNTSPNKTLGGMLGAIVIITILTVLLGKIVFKGSELDSIAPLIGLGLLTSFSANLGDLTISSIKRGLGIKDMSNMIPGHGGLLDRFDSFLLTAPVFFHYVGYFIGFGKDQTIKILVVLNLQ